MPISIVVPQLGESVAEGTVSKWLKGVGERVRKEEPLVEIQTDKINVEIPSPAEGTLEKILVQEGTTVLVGTEIAVLAGAGEATSAGARTETPQQQQAKPAAPPKPEAAPVLSTQPSRQQEEGMGPRPSREEPRRAPEPVQASRVNDGGNGHGGDGETRNLSPAVRKIMRDENVSLQEVTALHGSGVGGRVTRDDLIDYLRSRASRPAMAGGAATATAAPPAPPRESGPRPGFLSGATAAATAGPREEVVPFTKVRKLISEHMVQSKREAPHVTTFDEADMTAVSALRKEFGPRLEAQGVKLTYMPFFIKASVLALKEYPWVNGSVRGDTMVLKRYYNVGIAVGRDEKGLIVPNVKDADRKNLAQLAADVNDIAARARNDRLRIEEIEGGTFSITNAGVFGALNSAPIINFPEVAILGVHKIAERPVIRDGQIVARPMMNLALSFDHRVIDGELAVKFLRRVCELLERPELLWFYA